MRKTALLIAATLLLLTSCSPRGERSITAADLGRHVGYLASDTLQGRYTGGTSIATAEAYIAQAFEKAGLIPIPGEDDYYFDYTAWRQGYDPDATSLEITGGPPTPARAVLGVDFRPFEFSGLGRLEAPLVFAGYGITAPEYDWDDYRGLDVRGRIVLLLRYEPGEKDPASPFDGTTHTTHALFATKVKNAQTHGAVGMLLVTTPLDNSPTEDLRPADSWRLHAEELAGREGRRDPGDFLALQLSQAYADGIAQVWGTTIADLQRAVNQGTIPATLALPTLSASISVTRQSVPVPVSARNVVGYLPGREPGEIVVVGAHHDHIGAFDASGEDTVYNGADDNASGVAGVLELAQAFGLARDTHRKGIVFATFSGEEEYLLGSQALAESALLPAGTVHFMLNLDMIGRNPDDPLAVYGSSSGTGLKEMLESANQGTLVRLDYPVEMPAAMSSDHASFQRRGVPVLFFHTGLHPDYHGLDDEADRLDYRHMERIVRLGWRVLIEQAGG